MNKIIKDPKEIALQIALSGLKIGAIKINFEKPFLWASGTYNPFYNDNRMFLKDPEHRKLIIEGFLVKLTSLGFDSKTSKIKVIAGTATAGIPPATLLADVLGLSLIYIRDKPKNHGMKNRIEGIGANEDLKKQEILLIEDLISTGGSSASAVQAIRDANGFIEHCFSIFNYELPEAKSVFAGKKPFDKTEKEVLSKECHIHSLLSYKELVEIAYQHSFIKKSDCKKLEKWMSDRENWGDLNGFPREK